MTSRLTSRSSHAERDGDKRSLTEPAVDDFARAKQAATIGQDLARADWIPLLRFVRRQTNQQSRINKWIMKINLLGIKTDFIQ